MSVRHVLLIETVANLPCTGTLDLMASVDSGRVWLEVVGGQELPTLEMTLDDWRELAAFVAEVGTDAGTRPEGSRAAPRAEKPARAPARPEGSRLDEAAVVVKLRELAQDGEMPTRAAWDALRGRLPHSVTLIRRHMWAEWAALAGLRPSDKALRMAERAAAQNGMAGGNGIVAAVMAAPAVTEEPAGEEMPSLQAAATDPTARRRLVNEVVYLLREMAEDGALPGAGAWDARRPAWAPAAAQLVELLGLARWEELAGFTKLEKRRKQAGEHSADSSDASFRDQRHTGGEHQRLSIVAAGILPLG